MRGERLLVLRAEGGTVRLRVESAEGGLNIAPGTIVTLRLNIQDGSLKPGQPVCIFGAHRPQRSDRPYRALRVVY